MTTQKNVLGGPDSMYLPENGERHRLLAVLTQRRRDTGQP